MNNLKDVRVFQASVNGTLSIPHLYGPSGTRTLQISGCHHQANGFQTIFPANPPIVLMGHRFGDPRFLIEIRFESVEHRLLLGPGEAIGLKPFPARLLEPCLGEYHPFVLNPDCVHISDYCFSRRYVVRTPMLPGPPATLADVEEEVVQALPRSATISGCSPQQPKLDKNNVSTIYL